jgi:methylenetetrahydrofolate reductase (NADPH)
MERDSSPDGCRYEVLPFGSVVEQAEAVGEPLTLTVTCSPRQGPDRTVELAAELRALGHRVIVHLAARMVSGPEHLDALLRAMAAADLRDAFVIGGDVTVPAGSYGSALELMTDMRAHHDAPATIGVGAYPEGHPLIADDVLLDDLMAKDGLADYMVTQMCFDAAALVGWLQRMRQLDLRMPAYLGVPGAVDRRRLLEISLRVGVGTSISFLRKQRGAGRLFGHGRGAVEDLRDHLAALVGGELGVAGTHFYTFNRLIETVRFAELTRRQPSPDPRRIAGPRSAAIKQESRRT